MTKTAKATHREKHVCYEVEFIDMKHTLEWLLETARRYNCDEAIKHLKMAKKYIRQKERAIFD